MVVPAGLRQEWESQFLTVLHRAWGYNMLTAFLQAYGSSLKPTTFATVLLGSSWGLLILESSDQVFLKVWGSMTLIG